MAKHTQARSFFWVLIRLTGKITMFFASLQAKLIMAETRWTRRFDK